MNAAQINEPGMRETIENTFNQNLLFLIAHCYPKSTQNHERFKQCTVIEISDDPLLDDSTKKALSFIIPGSIAASIVVLRLIKKWKNGKKSPQRAVVIDI